MWKGRGVIEIEKCPKLTAIQDGMNANLVHDEDLFAVLNTVYEAGQAEPKISEILGQLEWLTDLRESIIEDKKEDAIKAIDAALKMLERENA